MHFAAGHRLTGIFRSDDVSVKFIRAFMRQGLPVARPGQVIGLLGGSFDPPHSGHVHITREALKRFGLNRVWWLVSPGNPLKREGPAPLARRMAAAWLKGSPR